MGLDMYLNKKTFIGAKYEHRKIDGKVSITQDEKPIEINFKRIKTIEEEVLYWRKANQIHKWFVDNVQDGKDNCGEYYVSKDQLKTLLNICIKTMETKNADLLPTCKGFFFGCEYIDDYYFYNVQKTIDILTEEFKTNSESDYYYSSSW